jgi:hypothetical protein
MRRGPVLALVFGLLVVGLLGYTALWVTSTGGGAEEPSVTVTTFEPRLSVNTLTLAEATDGTNGTTSCISTGPPPEGWSLTGSLVLERNGSGPASSQQFAWRLDVDDGAVQSNGTVELERYESARVTLFDVGDYTGDLEPGSTATAELAITRDGKPISSTNRSIDVLDSSEPVCPDA